MVEQGKGRGGAMGGSRQTLTGGRLRMMMVPDPYPGTPGYGDGLGHYIVT